jgi:N-acetylglucosamine kinase-like BadF-type ATPase
MDFFLGIDGGGTRTRAVLVDAHGVIHGEGVAGPANYHNVGLPAASAALHAATSRAWNAAGRAFAPAAACFAGLAGVKSASDIAQLTSAAETAGLAPAGCVTVTNDLHNALAGGLVGNPGISLIAGTGSNCLGRDIEGSMFMCGGWGWLLDDEGGAVGLALAGLRAAARAADGRGPATALLQAAYAFFGLSEANEILGRLYAPPITPDQLAPFAQVVTRLAAERDAKAEAIIDEGAAALAALVAGTAKKLSFPEGPAVVLLGSCARSGAPYQPRIEKAIRAAVPRARLVEPAYEPVYGAAFNVLRAAGKKLPSLLHIPPQ